MVVPDNAQVKKVDIQINPGSAVTPLIAKNPFTFENINFTPDQYFPRVTVLIKSSFEKQVNHVRVVALACGDKGAIIGGRIHLCGLCAWQWAGGGRHERERDRQAGQVGFLRRSNEPI